MINDHLGLVKTIINTVELRWWPSVFAGIIAREHQDKAGLSRYLTNILHGRLQAGLIGDVPFDLVAESLIPDVDFPKAYEGIGAHSVGFVPSSCSYNGVEPIFDSQEALSVFGLSGHEPEISAVVYAIEKYTEQIVNPLRCAVHPYVDCVLLTALLFAIRNRISGGNIIKFEEADWADLPDVLAGDHPFDLTYMSSELVSLAQRQPFEFREVKKGASIGRILFNSRAFEHAASERAQHDRRGPASTMRGVNFNGDFDPKKNAYIWNFEDSTGKNVPVLLEGVRSDFDDEAKMLIALANGALSCHAVVPSLQGFLWAAESGLLETPDGLIGTLISKTLTSSQGKVGYGIRPFPQFKDGQDRANFVLTALCDLQKLVLSQISSTAQKEITRKATRIIGAMKAPIVYARGYDSGILARIPPVLALRAAFPGGTLFEKESTYVPPWWGTLLSPDASEGMDVVGNDNMSKLRSELA